MSSLPRTSGIYRITCTANGKIYIGSAVNLLRRYKSHFYHLKKGTHYNPHLQRAYEKHGVDSFAFDVLELCGRDILIEREQHFLILLQPFRENGFNIALDARAPMLGRTSSQETIDKLRVINTGRKHTPETIAKMSVARKGIKPTPEVKAQMSARRKGRKHTPEAIAKMVAIKTGLKASPETRAKLSAAKKGFTQSSEAVAKRSRQWVVTTPDGIEIIVIGLNRFCIENNLHQGAMWAVANGRKSHHKGWLCRYCA